MTIKLWNSRWAERLVRLARTGLKHVGVVPAAPQLTDIALGRATDALFLALPASTRRELRDLPATVRRLEADAQTLRDQIEQVERSVRELSADAGYAASRSVADAREEGLSASAERRRLVADLSATRDLAKGRLAASVAALENIRLGLMRLQIGGAPVGSVTTAIEAAHRVAEDVARAAEAEAEVSGLLKRPLP
jgi:chromosome segregation ATPase